MSRRWIATAAAAGLLLTACGDGERRVEPPPRDSASHPVVAVPQAQGILDAVDEAVEAGISQRKQEAFGDRVIGPYRALALAQAKVDAERKVKPVVPEVERVRLLVPSGMQWPRFFLVAGNAEGEATPVLRVVASATARDQYGLWAELRMLPGATLPKVAPATQGSPAVTPDDGQLAVAPKDVVPRFAAHLNSGGKAEAATFRPNVFAQQVLSRTAADRKNLVVTSTHTSDPRSLFAMRTADGGAIVIGSMVQRYTVKPKPGFPGITVDPVLAALSGKKRADTFTRTALEVVAFAVPPRGRGPATVIAAQKGDVAAVAK